MPARPCILALDQGTTSTRAILFDEACRIVGTRQRELTQRYPAPGWVEHDPEEIWAHTLELCRAAVADADAGGYQVAALGITNQRETTLAWERASGRPIHNAIVWQDRRTADVCRQLLDAGHEALVRERTGLVVDPYFSATKLAWLLDNVPGARARAERGELAFGTVDSFLLWRLTGGRVHATDASNASRTMLFNLRTQDWDPEVAALLRVPAAVLPEVRDCAGAFGVVEGELLGRAIPIGGVAGDQQAASIGQACFEPGMVKSTYGTGAFVLLNTGEAPVASRNRLLTTVAYRMDGRVTYALEGSIFVAGAAVQWLRDRLGLIASAADTERLAAGLENNGGVYMVPAFTGLGAPYWDPAARAAILGLSSGSGPAEIARGALEAVCYQTRDLVEAMAEDSRAELATLRVDGGMAVNDWLLQFLADVLGSPVERPAVTETTALGAACLAGLQAGLFDSFDDVRRRWQRQALFQPGRSAAEREALVAGWRDAVARVRARPSPA